MNLLMLQSENLDILIMNLLMPQSEKLDILLMNVLMLQWQPVWFFFSDRQPFRTWPPDWTCCYKNELITKACCHVFVSCINEISKRITFFWAEDEWKDHQNFTPKQMMNWSLLNLLSGRAKTVVADAAIVAANSLSHRWRRRLGERCSAPLGSLTTNGCPREKNNWIPGLVLCLDLVKKQRTNETGTGISWCGDFYIWLITIYLICWKEWDFQ
jgi:hypothetical protein